MRSSKKSAPHIDVLRVVRGVADGARTIIWRDETAMSDNIGTARTGSGKIITAKKSKENGNISNNGIEIIWHQRNEEHAGDEIIK